MQQYVSLVTEAHGIQRNRIRKAPIRRVEHSEGDARTVLLRVCLLLLNLGSCNPLGLRDSKMDLD